MTRIDRKGAPMPSLLEFDVALSAISEGYDRQTCWVHPRGGVIPPSTVVVTMQKLQLTGMDVFYGLHEMRTDDRGKTWTEPIGHDSLMRRDLGDGVAICPSDFWPAWHARSRRLLGTGHTCLYRDNQIPSGRQFRQTVYSVYDAAARRWMDWKTLDLTGTDMAENSGAGCTQRVDLPDGDILLPVYGSAPGANSPWTVTVLRCGFDGHNLSYKEQGSIMASPVPVGFYEPSLVEFNGRFYMTIRNEEDGFVAVSRDGLHFDAVHPWTYDDGQPLRSVSTQQHWIAHSEGLFLAYCRRGPENARVFRHRAPLFVAQIDPECLCVIRASERAVIPDRGATLGNFGTVNVNREESWVIDAEWMQHGLDAPWNDCTACEKGGGDNAVWVARLRWAKPNYRV